MTEDKPLMSEKTQQALAKGAADGPELLTWLRDRGADVTETVAVMSWVLAYLVFTAHDTERSHQILNGFAASLHLYGEFLCDMAEAEIAKQAEPETTKETRH